MTTINLNLTINLDINLDELRDALHDLVDEAMGAGVDPMDSVALLREVATYTEKLVTEEGRRTEAEKAHAAHLDVLDTTCRPLSDK